MDYSSEKIFRMLKNGPMGLIVSLPGNKVELAAAAQSGGADMIKIHLNVTHAASGIHFGAFNEERDGIEQILKAVDIPVGIMPGAATTASMEDMLELEKMGISFFDIYITDMPAGYLNLKNMEPMAALGHDWRYRNVAGLNGLGVKLTEASIVKHEDYGKPLLASDLMDYSSISSGFDGAVIVPTQKKIEPGEVELLRRAGVSGIMIGKIVTGDTPAGLESATAEFASAIAGLKKI